MEGIFASVIITVLATTAFAFAFVCLCDRFEERQTDSMGHLSRFKR